LVFIGHGMNEAALRAALDGALLICSQMLPCAWAALPDPFPTWQRSAA
jgi:hypothetical protein